MGYSRGALSGKGGHRECLPDYPLITEECKQALEQAFYTSANLGIPVATHKVQDPTTCLWFLGMELDTQALQLRLPAKKLSRLHSLIKLWQGNKSCVKRDLLSLIG